MRRMALRLAVAAVVLLALSVPAFWPQYLSRPGESDAYTHFHAGLGLAWLLLLIGQPLLVRARRLDLHRRIGRVGWLLGAAFAVSGVLVAHRGVARMDEAELARDGFFLYMPLAQSALFAVALALGIAWRSEPATHARYMACTALPLLDPLLARLLHFYFPPLPARFLYQLPAFFLTVGVLAVLSGSMPRSSRGRGGFRAFAAGTIVTLLLFFVTPYSAAWATFVAWFRALPVT